MGGVSMESPPATALHIQGSLGHLYSIPPSQTQHLLHASWDEVLPPSLPALLWLSTAFCRLPSV